MCPLSMLTLPTETPTAQFDEIPTSAQTNFTLNASHAIGETLCEQVRITLCEQETFEQLCASK